MRFCASGIGLGLATTTPRGQPQSLADDRPQKYGCEPTPDGSSMLHVPSGPGFVGVANRGIERERPCVS